MCQIRKLRWTHCCHESTTEELCNAEKTHMKAQRKNNKKGWWCKMFSASPPSKPRCRVTTTTGGRLGICEHCKRLLAENNRKAHEKSRYPRHSSPPLPPAGDSRASAKQAAARAAETYRWCEENGRQRDSYIPRRLLEDYYLLPDNGFEPVARGQAEFQIYREPELPYGPQLLGPPTGQLPHLPPLGVRNKSRAAPKKQPGHAGRSLANHWEAEISPPSSPPRTTRPRRPTSPVSPLSSLATLYRDRLQIQDRGMHNNHRKGGIGLRNMPSALSRLDREIQAAEDVWNASL